MKARKPVLLLLALALALSLSIPALAAGDVTWSKDTTLTNFINRYDNATVKAGVTLTMKEFKPDPQGLEIVRSLTVEESGRITGGGTIIFERGATCTGLDLYYRVAGVEKRLPVTLAELIEQEPSADYRPTFLYDNATGHYVLVADYANDPFEAPTPGDGGSAGGADTRTEQLAEALRSLGLFLGGDAGFELDRAPTRVEEVIMLLRLLGNKDDDLRVYPAGNMPFDDVPGWAKGYVAFAYDHNLANGTGAGKFGADVPATAQMFATFVLRALGYNDNADKGAVDFTYAGAVDFAMDRGLIAGQGDVDGFNRGTCVRMMESALRQNTKGGDLLWRELAREGVFTEDAYKTAFNAN